VRLQVISIPKEFLLKVKVNTYLFCLKKIIFTMVYLS